MEADEYFYWCFVCKKECLVIETDEGELQCDNCSSTFVEELPYKQKIPIITEVKSENYTQKENSSIFKESIIINNDAESNHNNDLNQQVINSQNNHGDPLIDLNPFPQNFSFENNNQNVQPNFSNDVIFDDPRNFIPQVNQNSNNINNPIGIQRNFGSGISLSQSGGNTLFQVSFDNSNFNQGNNNLSGMLSNTINSIFSNITGNNRNILNISNNIISFNLNNFLGENFMQGIDLNSFLGRNINDNAFENLLNIVMSFDNNRGNPPASEEEINQLERVEISVENYDKYAKESCSICYDGFEKAQKLINLSCLHFFHENCIITWLRTRNQCPICRKELRTDDQTYENRRRQNRDILNNWRRNNDNNNDGGLNA